MRRFAASTYEDLQHRVSTLFSLDAFLLKYQDEEGDLVTVSSEWELEEALRCQGPVLKLNVETADDQQSGDFILVEKDCVVHVDQSANDELSDAVLPSPLSIEHVSSTSNTSSSSEATPMALTPLLSISTHTQSVPVPVPVSVKAEQFTNNEPLVAAVTPMKSDTPMASETSTNVNVSKRSYAEACEAKLPYSQGTHKAPTYIISVSNSAANPRSAAQPHATSSTSTTPYVKAAEVRQPYAKGKDGLEFTQTPKVSAPYAQGKSRTSPAQASGNSPYVSQTHAAKPFTQVK